MPPIPNAKTGRNLSPQAMPSAEPASVDGKILAQYEKNATSQLKLFALDGKPLGDVALPAIGSILGIGGKWDRKEVFYGFNLSPSRPLSTARSRIPKDCAVGQGSTPISIPQPLKFNRSGTPRKTEPRSPCSSFTRKGCNSTARIPPCLPDTAASTSA